MVKLFSRLKHIGIFENTTYAEIKKIRLLNIFCICWLGFLALFGVTDYIFMPDPRNNLILHGFSAVFISIVLVLQQKKLYTLARILYLAGSLVVYMLFANLLETNSLMEYFILLVPMLSLLFLDQKWLHWTILIVCYLCFYAPILYFKHYQNVDVNPITNFILFFAVFVLVNYFKNINLKNESLLHEEKNKALEAKDLLEKQQSELTELYAFQNHFMVNLSHEIRTPLTLIKGASSQLRNVKEREKQELIFDRIDNNSDKIKHLVDNIIDLAKMNSKKLELNNKLFHIIPFLLKISSSYDSHFRQKGIVFSIENEVINENMMLNGDKIYLERAISNLIMNAQKYCESGDSVFICIKQVNKHIRFEIHDTGCGIPKEELNNIFLPFYRAKNSVNQAGGSGVGLSFAKEVIDLHQGKIEVKSILGEGACFCIELPVLESEQTLFVQETRYSKQKSKFANTEILLAEDNKEMQNYLKSVLSSFQVSVANNGKEALELLEKTNFTLIITDYMMPVMDGFQFIESIKSKGISTPIIVLTARMDDSGKLDFLRLGIDDYLTKPFNEEELLIRIENCLANNLVKNEPMEEVEGGNPNFVMEAKNIVLASLSSLEFGVLDLAEALAMTERTLNRRLKTETGLTPNGFIREIKLLEAYKVIESKSGVSLKEIALNLGFKNSSHFGTLYESRFGKKFG